MKYLFAVSLLLLTYLSSIAQNTPERAIFRFESIAFNLCVTPAEKLIITTKAGEAASANNITSPWKSIKPVNESGIISGETYEQSNFFNNDTGFISGFISYNNGYKIIRHTTDGGKTWKTIEFGQSGWIDDAVHLDNGEAWLSVAGSGIAYTKDYGFTWKKFNIPEITQRFASVFFNSKREGIIGSLWNMLAYTNDNCGSWKLLPTPLDQKKYRKTNPESRPEFNKVAIFNNYLLVSQEGMVFYSKRDSINWIWLPAYTNFDTDADNTALYFRTTKGNYVATDSELNVSASYPFSGPAYASKCKNGNLFIMCGDKIAELKQDKSIAGFPIYGNDYATMNPDYIGHYNNQFYGSLNNKIYSQASYNSKWEYRFTLPFAVDSGILSIPDEKHILFSRKDDSLFYYDIKKKTTQITSAALLINQFCASEITSITFNKGSQGCFHHYNDEWVYTREDNTFEMGDVKSKGVKHKSYSFTKQESFSSELADSFQKQIPAFIKKMPAIEDLDFTENDYEKCRNNILDFKNSVERDKKRQATSFQFYKNNIDFDKLLSLVDSIRYLQPVVLDKILRNLSEMYSTTSNWSRVDLRNNSGDMLSIISYYYEANSFYFPWMININGYEVEGNWIEVNQFLNKVLPGFLNSKESNSKIDILHTIVKRLYD